MRELQMRSKMFCRTALLLSGGLAAFSIASSAVAGEVTEPQAFVQTEPVEWFPQIIGERHDLTISRSPAHLVTTPTLVVNEQALIPIPPGGWTGLAGLSTIGIFGWRRALHRYIKK
jgi:hypothetical protein